jgi:hypothetical protein
MDKIIALVNDLIEMEKARDAEHKALAIAAGKASKAVGESAILFHLKGLKELCEAEDKRRSAILNQTTIVNLQQFLTRTTWKTSKRIKESHIGKMAKVTKENHSWFGKKGFILNHYVNADDCGDFDQIYYLIGVKEDSGQYPVRAEDCSLIEELC